MEGVSPNSMNLREEPRDFPRAPLHYFHYRDIPQRTSQDPFESGALRACSRHHKCRCKRRIVPSSSVPFSFATRLLPHHADHHGFGSVANKFVEDFAQTQQTPRDLLEGTSLDTELKHIVNGPSSASPREAARIHLLPATRFGARSTLAPVPHASEPPGESAGEVSLSDWSYRRECQRLRGFRSRGDVG